MEGRKEGKHEVLAPNIQLCKHAECVGDPCVFGCHSDCLKAIDRVGNSDMGNTGFECNSISVQMRPTIVHAILTSDIDTITKKRQALTKTRQIKKIYRPKKTSLP